MQHAAVVRIDTMEVLVHGLAPALALLIGARLVQILALVSEEGILAVADHQEITNGLAIRISTSNW